MQENIPELEELKKHWLEPSCPEIEMFMNLRNWREPNKHDMQENIPELEELKNHWLEPSCPEIEMFMNLLERTQQTWWTLKNIESVFLSDWGWIMTPFITPLWHSSLSLRVLETTPSSIFRAHCNNDIKLRDHPYIMSVKRWVGGGGQMLRIKGLRTSMRPKFSDHQVFLGKLRGRP